MIFGQYIGHPRLPFKNSGTSTKYFLSSMMRVKNEARFLPELIAHHHLLGVEHFYLYDNGSEDNLTYVLQPFLDLGLVTIVPWLTVPCAPSCYVHFFDNYASECQWVAFLDADEFLIERQEGALIEFIKSHPSLPALAINWRYFGSSFHESIPEGLVLRNFTMADTYMDTLVKVIAQPSDIESLYNSHNFIYKGFGIARDIDSRPALGSQLNMARTKSRNIEINHYVYRARENYVAKLGIGYVDAEGYKRRARHLSLVDSEFQRHNEVVDDFAAERFSERVRSLLKRLGYGIPYV
jgi:hypothetical protein